MNRHLNVLAYVAKPLRPARPSGGPAGAIWRGDLFSAERFFSVGIIASSHGNSALFCSGHLNIDCNASSRAPGTGWLRCGLQGSIRLRSIVRFFCLSLEKLVTTFKGA
jgi:hypothetical protein